MTVKSSEDFGSAGYEAIWPGIGGRCYAARPRTIKEPLKEGQVGGEETTGNFIFDGLQLNRRGLFRLDEAGRPAPVAIGSRALDLLLVLATHWGAVVSKDDLMKAVWPGIAVEESNLTKQISALRRALDRTPGSGSCIQTVPGRGYRFVATVTEIDQARLTTPPLPPAGRPSIAVLPFQNLSGDPEQDYFAAGITEEITTAIARFPRLLVCARISSYASKSGPVMAAAAGPLATVALRIWGDRFDGTLDDIFALQDRAAAAVACAIEPRLRLAEIERISRNRVEDLDCYGLNLRAAAMMSKRTKQGFAAAIALLHRALNLDPTNGPAMARTGYLRLMQATRHWIPRVGAEVEEGIEVARRAIVESNGDPEVLTDAGQTLAFFLGDTEAALSAFERAIGLNPNYAHAFGQRAMIFAWLDRPEDAIRAAQKAIGLSPYAGDVFVCWLALAIAHLTAGRWEDAMRAADHALRENAGTPALRLKLSLCGHLGWRDEAKACIARLREVHSEPTIASIRRDLGKGMSAEVVARLIEGLHNTGLPAQ
jgi:DNA-binding winged helix-turn-helix (wHTH) protein/tetratricopeptide (TPR) repeat protein